MNTFCHYQTICFCSVQGAYLKTTFLREILETEIYVFILTMNLCHISHQHCTILLSFYQLVIALHQLLEYGQVSQTFTLKFCHQRSITKKISVVHESAYHVSYLPQQLSFKMQQQVQKNKQWIVRYIVSINLAWSHHSGIYSF